MHNTNMIKTEAHEVFTHSVGWYFRYRFLQRKRMSDQCDIYYDANEKYESDLNQYSVTNN